MIRRPTPACRWLLEQEPELLKRLPRAGNEFVELGDSPKLGLRKVRIFVPENLRVYQVMNHTINETELLFAASEELYRPAYASAISADENGCLDYLKNVADLKNYPWADHETSSRLLHRVISGNLSLIQGFYAQRPHPLLG